MLNPWEAPELLNWAAGAAITLLAGVVGLAMYRLYFHPLAEFPGRRLAVVTMWYEFYYDVIKRGQYVFEIQKMHEEYGILPFQSVQELRERADEWSNKVQSSALIRTNCTSMTLIILNTSTRLLNLTSMSGSLVDTEIRCQHCQQ